MNTNGETEKTDKDSDSERPPFGSLFALKKATPELKKIRGTFRDSSTLPDHISSRNNTAPPISDTFSSTRYVESYCEMLT
jgi:hypothetical protein